MRFVGFDNGGGVRGGVEDREGGRYEWFYRFWRERRDRNEMNLDGMFWE